RLPLAVRRVNAFRLCGSIGLLAACGVALGVTAATGLSLATETALIAVAVAVFVALALGTKAVTGREQLIYYHHEIAVLACDDADVGVRVPSAPRGARRGDCRAGALGDRPAPPIWLGRTRSAGPATRPRAGGRVSRRARGPARGGGDVARGARVRRPDRGDA